MNPVFINMRALAALLLLPAAPTAAASLYKVRPDDPKAIQVTREAFGARGDGVADDTEAIQKAIDQVQATSGQGIVLLPEGRYRLTKALNVWPAIRLIGFGATRPVLVLGPNTPGYQDPNNESYMVFFAGRRPGAPDPARPAPQRRVSGRHGLNLSQPWDATPGTFYSALSNVDIEIGEGNPGAVGVRARYAQHCFLAHMDFHIGSALAGVHDGGNEIEDVRFLGGQYGVITRKPSPGWQFTLVDTTFEGQTVAAIKTHEAGLTLVHPVFRKVPTAISIDPDYVEQLWMKEGRLEDVSGPAIVISREKSSRTEINLEDVVCRNVPWLVSFRESGKKIEGPAATYAVKTFSHGLHYADLGVEGEIETRLDAKAMDALPADRADLPALPPIETWANVRALGAAGDGTTDDTEAIRKAIAEHRTVYFPQGHYRVSDTILLRPDTVLVALHPSTTALVLADGTPAFEGVGGPKALLEAPAGGTNIVSGLGLDTNGTNPRAVGAKWMAGRASMMNDVRLLGGHGTSKMDGTRLTIYNNNHTADPNLDRRWDGQYASLWVTNGGGGRFVNIWTPSPYAQAGLYVSDTSTEGRVYQMSSEHHVRAEVVLRNVSNWAFYALQTEEERGESGFALPLEIDRSSAITIANLFMYRVVSSNQTFPYAIKVTDSRDIRFRNVHGYSDSKVSFDNAVYDETHDLVLRQRELAWLTLSGSPPKPKARAASPVLEPGAKMERLATGFFNIAGGAVDPAGDFFFVDARWQRIHRWSAATRRVSVVRDNVLDPTNLVFDDTGHLIVFSYAGKGVVYSFKPNEPGQEIQLLPPQPAQPRPDATPVLPVDHYRLENDWLEEVPVRKPHHVVSPDGGTFIPVGDDFVTGRLYYGARLHDVLRAFSLARVVPGQPFYVSDESEHQTYAATVDEFGTLSKMTLFADRGGEGLAVDAHGNVYLAAGQIYVYDASGRLIDTIDVPERPAQLAFGGKDGKTLFIAARTSLYAVRTRFAGREAAARQMSDGTRGKSRTVGPGSRSGEVTARTR